MPMKTLTQVVHDAVVGPRVTLSIPDMAARLGCAPSTLYNRLNPFDPTNNLPLEHAHRLMLFVGSADLAEAMASGFGMRLAPMAGREPDGLDMDHERLQGYDATAAFLELAPKAERGEADPLELKRALERAIVELEDVMERVQRGM